MVMNLDGFEEEEEFEPTRLVLSGIFDGDVTRSLLAPVFPPETGALSCFFAFHALWLDGETANFCCLAGAGSFPPDRSRFDWVGVLSGFVGVPWIGDSLLGVLAACRREARLATLLLFPEAFKRFLESVKRPRESVRRPNLGEESRSVDLLSDVER